MSNLICGMLRSSKFSAQSEKKTECTTDQHLPSERLALIGVLLEDNLDRLRSRAIEVTGVSGDDNSSSGSFTGESPSLIMGKFIMFPQFWYNRCDMADSLDFTSRFRYQNTRFDASFLQSKYNMVAIIADSIKGSRKIYNEFQRELLYIQNFCIRIIMLRICDYELPEKHKE